MTNRLWSFVSDMNFDGSITVSDVGLWIGWLFFYPGDWIISMIVGTGFGNFFEFSYLDFGGLFSGFIGGAIYFILFILFIAATTD